MNADELGAIGGVVARYACVRAAWVFGSLVGEGATADSDLDIAVLLGAPASRADRDALRFLSLELERFSPARRVDIVVLGEQGPVFRHRVLTSGVIVLDHDPALRMEFEASTIAEYLDWKPTHDLAMSAALGGIRRRLASGVAQ